MISTGQIIVILIVVLLLFGTKRLRNIGSDLGSAIKGFKTSMSDGEQDAKKDQDTNTAPPANPSIAQQQQPGNRVIDQAPQKQDERKS
jgi:sec-independent protein translocase protein TatA